MQLRLDRTRALLALAGVGLSFVLIAIVLAPRSKGGPLAPSSPPPPGSCADLARDVDPSKVPVDSGYDPEKDVVYAHHAGRTYVMKPNDPVCRALNSARAVIDDTMNANRENVAVACKVMKDIVANRRTQFRGKAVNQDAAQRFIARRCGAGQP